MKKKLVLIMILVLIIAMPSGCFLKKKLVDSTTKEVPTTVAPTTTTAAPTKPTTARPTTVKATTTAPTAVESTTIASTTAEPTIVAPTTAAPTTAAPTTKQTTATPTTTVPPTTAAPTTTSPATAAPTTAAPTTVAPTTAAPTAWIEAHSTTTNYDGAMTYRAENGYESIPRDATLDALAQARAEELAILGELNHNNMPNSANWEGLSTTITAGSGLYFHCGDGFAATSIGIGAATYHRADGTTYSVCCMLLRK